MKSTFRLAVFTSIVALVTIGCPPHQEAGKPPATAKNDAGMGGADWKMSKTGVGFRLSDAEPQVEPPAPPAPASKLSESDTQKIFARMPALKEEEGDKKTFALREKSLPAPRPGKTVKESFPPAATNGGPAPAAIAGALEVVRKMPEGEVSLAPHLSVTFNQPMVPVTSHADLGKRPVPVTLTPSPPGEWIWVGTKTVQFKPKERFPMSTEYTVEVPAGTKSDSGSTLAQAVKWKFTTPTLQVQSATPNHNSVGRSPMIVMTFDQNIKREDLFRFINVTAGNAKVPVHLVDPEEEEAKDAADDDDDGNDYYGYRYHTPSNFWKGDGKKDRWIAFKPNSELPIDTDIHVKLEKGAPSAEGPRKLPGTYEFSFRTYGPFKLTEAKCGWNDDCEPFTPFWADFTNAIDAKAVEKGLVTVSPEIAGMKVAASGDNLTVSGRTKGRTKYRVTYSRELKDVFGQKLGRDETREFYVKNATPRLFPEERMMSVADPLANGKLSVFSINIKNVNVKLYKVKPEHFGAYTRYRNEWDREMKLLPVPGDLAWQGQVKLKGEDDELSETQIDLSPALAGGLGQVIAIIEPLGMPAPKYAYEKQWIRQWTQVTKIGMDLLKDHEDAVGWATNLFDGASMPGVTFSWLPNREASAPTDANGIARFKLTEKSSSLLQATKGNDLAFIASENNYNYWRWNRDDTGLGLSRHAIAPSSDRFFVIDDRGMYKPKESVSVKGWIRQITHGKDGDVGAFGSSRAGTYVVHDGRHAEIGKGDYSIDEFGGFNFVFKLPDTANLGHASIQLRAGGAYGSHAFQIQEFRTPEFEVSMQTPSDKLIVGGYGVATVSAKYYAGGGLPYAETNWSVSRSEAHFSPPNRSEYHFGSSNSWWWQPWKPKKGKTSETWQAKTDANGDHRLRIDFDAVDPYYPMSLSLLSTVTDVNRQAWSSSGTLLVHPADVYVGFKQEKGFVRAGQPIKLQTIVADIDGKLVAGRKVSIRSVRKDWEQISGKYQETEKDESKCEFDSRDAEVPCELSTKDGGQYEITAIVTDSVGRKSQTRTQIYVLGDKPMRNRNIKPDQIQIIPDKKEYAAGDIAEVLLVLPFSPAEGVFSLGREGIVSVERFRAESSTHVMRVRVEEKWTPNVNIVAHVVGQGYREDESGEISETLPKRPAYAAGTSSLSIPPVERKVLVTVTPGAKKFDPGAKVSVGVATKDVHGKPLSGDIALIVVDEAVLALSNYKLPDILQAFYSSRGSGMSSIESRKDVLLAKPVAALLQAPGVVGDSFGKGGLGMRGSGIGGGGAGYGAGLGAMSKSAPRPSAPPAAVAAAPAMEREEAPKRKAESKAVDRDDSREAKADLGMATTAINQRIDFSALAAFVPSTKTDSKGYAEISVKLPDNLTRYRIMAVAVSGAKMFGQGEETITARLPLMVRPSAPRFLNWGDKFEFPIVVQNQTDKPMDVGVAVRAINANFTDGQGRRTTVPANDRVEIRIPATTADVGKAKFQVGAASGSLADAAVVELPVWTPATTEAFATYGTIDEGAIAQAVKRPDGVAAEFGGLEITTSSTALQALTDAVLYLVRYPYECNEQLSSRILGVAALRDVLTAFKAEGLPKPEEMLESVTKDVARLKSRQNWNGGWDFWPSTQTDPWVSVHVSHALARAKQKGFTVPEDMVTRSKGYLQNIESHIPWWYGESARRTVIAYATYVRAQHGDYDRAKMKGLISQVGGNLEKLTIETVGWILYVLSGDAGSQTEIANIRKHLANRAYENAGTAHWVTSYGDKGYVLLHSERRDDAVVLEAVIKDDPKSDLIPKVVAGLLAHKKAGRWYNTQENAFVLLSLDKYFNTYENKTPDFIARVWLGDKYAGEHAYRGRQTERHHIDVPMKFLTLGKQENLTLSKDGPGRLYYRIGFQYAPTDLRPPAMDRGFAVTRSYEGADDPKDVRKDEQGIWHVKAGAKVRAKIVMFNEARRYHVALVDPMPAGFEAMNSALAVTGPIPKEDPKVADGRDYHYWWARSWYEHQNLRDERAEAFASYLWEGVHDFTYVSRATIPGRFVAPPPKAEEMYSPEVFGRGPGDIVIVE